MSDLIKSKRAELCKRKSILQDTINNCQEEIKQIDIELDKLDKEESGQTSLFGEL